MAGGRIDILVAPDVRDFVPQLRRGLTPAIAAAGAIGASMGLALGGAVAFAKVIEIGNEFTTNLNTMKAVASATATEMEAVSERAKQLGNDITLPGTSANDAAAAMTELAKGGFSVRQSMDAAKGSLQLAAAAQVDAAEAARIQSSALQAFGLQASEAGRVADVLANTSNASAAEISEVAYALQSGGAVAHQFGLTVEDTAAAVGMLANSGIRGSDAGTLLKSALLALTDQGKPAQEAIRELGLTVYDSQGNFIGLRSLIEQLDTAAGSMTPEMYQAATATLFGSDAMRLAAIAADKGVVGFDNMHRAMSRQGAAADVAAAKMQGLPGAMQMATNAAENLALEVYDLVKGPLEQLAKGAAQGITTATPMIVDGLQNTADAAISVGQAIGPVISTIADLPAPVLAAAAAFVVFRTTVAGAWLTSAVGAMQRFGTASVAVATASNRVVQVAGVGATTLGRFGSAVNQLGTTAPVIGRMQTSFLNAAAGANVLARTQGVIAAGATGLRAAAGGLVSLLGGPWVVAVVAAGAALYSLYSEMKKGSDYAKAMKSAMSEIGKQRAALAEIFSVNGGAFDDTAISNVVSQLGTMEKAMEDAGKNTSGFWGKTGGFFTGNLGEEFDKNWRADQWKGAKQVIDDLKMSSEQLAATLGDQAAFDTLATKLQGMGTHGEFALSELTALRDEIVKTQDTAKNTTPGFATLSQAVKVLSDESASAADRIDAMKVALDVLSGKPIAAQDALARYNEQVRQTTDATVEAWDAAKGWGDALILQNGQVNTTTENGGRLYDELMAIRDATITAAEAGVDMGPVLAQNQAAFAALGRAVGLDAAQVENMATQLGYLPRDIEILAQLRGADSVEQQLSVIEGLLRVNANGVEIPVEALTDEAKTRLTEAGGLIEEVNGKPGIVKVSAPNLAAVLTELQKLINTNLPDKTQKVNLEYQDATASGEWRAPMVLPAPRADGGVDGPLPGQATIQSPQSRLFQWAEPETGGEAFIPLAESKRARSTEILSQVAGMFGLGLTKMADGGIASTRAMDFLRGQSGKAYQYGGVGNPSWDCSGFISAAYALVKGLSPFTRWFTTESDFSSLGFLNGLDPTGRGLSVGIYRGGGGQYSHMAGLLGGVALESGANGVQVGSGAQSAASGQLPLKFYLPASAFNPPDAGGRNRRSSRTTQADTWDESDELELESARISANQARTERDEAMADAKKTPDDKRQAEIRARQAELRVQEMERDKSEANSTGGPVPEAPPLTGSMTDEEIRLADLHDSLEDAKFNRDEVYADPSSTDADRAAADREVYAAMNAEIAEQKKQREAAGGAFGSGSGSVVDMFGEAAKSFVTGQLSDVLTVAGLGGDVKGVIGAGIGIAAELDKKRREEADKPTPVNASAEELAKQGPVVPGTANWMQELMKTLMIPAVIRDMGGPLPNNTAAINTSGETEWVLTGADMRAAAASRPSPTQNIDNRMIIEHLSTGMTAAEFRREWKMKEIAQRDRSRGTVRR